MGFIIMKRLALGKEVAKLEIMVLKRLVVDLVMFVPVAVVMLVPMTPFGTAYVLNFLKKTFPDYFPSPFCGNRVALARAWRAVQRRQLDASWHSWWQVGYS